MSERDFEAENRAIKVDTVVTHILDVHSTLKQHGVLPDHSVPYTWVRHPLFPFDALRRASGAKHPCSEISYAMVLERLKLAESEAA